MKQVSGKDLAHAVERQGWRRLRVRGSHHIYAKDGTAIHLSIPIHGNKPLKIGLLRHLLKQAGMTEDNV